MPRLVESELGLVSGITLFTGLDTEELHRVIDLMERRSFRRGEVIYHKQDLPSGLYIILDGEVKTRILLPDDRQITFHIFRTGGYFGVHSLLAEGGRSTDAVAVTGCEALFFPRENFIAFLEAHPSAMYELLRVMAGMYRTAAQRMQDLALLDVRSRVAKELVHLGSRAVRSATQAEDDICLNISQGELAALVGATRESTNKWLRFFEQEGWIQLHRGYIRILRMDMLLGPTMTC
jgi:CRP/FNR family cyclic AMP-dependent transcriptional regulator